MGVQRDKLLIMLGLLALMVLISLTSAQQEEPELTGPNVCTRHQWESGWRYLNVSYDCWQSRYGPCPQDHRPGRWKRDHRWGRPGGIEGTGPSHWMPGSTEAPPWQQEKPQCILRSLTTCYKVLRRCVTSFVTKKYCCQGYEEQNGRCVRSIECSYNNGGCDQLCRRGDYGGHRCECFPGYRLEDRTRCVDTDECRGSNNLCDQTCQNTNGSYYCSCKNGYRLSSPNTCEEINECELGNGGCEHKCINTPGAFYCECEEGFDEVEGFSCDDIDECSLHGLNGGCSFDCINTWGGYHCVCPEGENLGPNGKTCSQGNRRRTTTPPYSTTTPRFREPTGGGGGGDMNNGNPGAERQMEGGDDDDDDGGAIPLGLILGCIIGVCVLAALILATLCFIRRYGLFARRGAGEERASGGGAAPVIAVIAPPLPPKKGGYAEAENHYEVPAASFKPAPRSYTNLAYKVEGAEGGYPEPPPSYDNALYDRVEEQDGIPPPSIPSKPPQAATKGASAKPVVPSKGNNEPMEEKEDTDENKVNVQRMKAMFEG